MDAAAEHEAVDRIDFKILGVANNERKLVRVLDVHLIPLLKAAQSPNATVRTKVIQICGRLKTFIRPAGVILPLKKLLLLYKETPSPIVRALVMSFVQHSISRVDEDVRRDLVPVVIRGIAKDAADKTTPSLYNVLLQMVADLSMPSRGTAADEEFREKIGLADPEDAKFLAYWFGRTILLRTQSQPGGSERTLASMNPGLTAEDLDFLRPERPESAKVYSNLPVLRRKLAELLASGAFYDDERFIAAIIASASADSRVSSIGIEMTKRSTVSLEDEAVVKSLYQLHSTTPADVRIRVLDRLSKSEIATTMPDMIAQVVELDFMTMPTETPRTGPDRKLLLQPASNLERTKLHKALFQFLTWVGKMGPIRGGDFAIGPLLVEKMRGFLQDSGWPIPAKQPLTPDEKTLRGVAYETLGLIARGSKLDNQARLGLAGFLFRSLAEDPVAEVVVHIDAGLSSLIRIFSVDAPFGALGSRVKNDFLRAMLLDYMTKDEDESTIRSVRYMAVKWANHCLPFSDKMARWIDILAVAGRADERSDVVDEGHKGLDPWTYYAHADGEKTLELPSWSDLATMFFGSTISAPIIGEEWLRGNDPLRAGPSSAFVNFQGGRLRAFSVAIDYCKQMMLLAAVMRDGANGSDAQFKIEADWMRRLEALMKTDNDTRSSVRNYLASVDAAYVVFLLNACLDGMLSDKAQIVEACATTFVDIASLSSSDAIGYISNRASELQPLLRSGKKEARVLAAQAMGILTAHPSNSDAIVEEIGSSLASAAASWESAAGAEAIAAEGACFALAHIASRAVFYGRSALFSDIRFPFKLLEGDNRAGQSLRDTAMDALAQLWTAGLALPGEALGSSMEDVIKLLVSPAKKANEKAIFTLGRLALACSPSETLDDSGNPPETNTWSRGHIGTILGELFKLHELKHVEVHFTIGEAITSAIAGWDSKFVQLTLDVETSNSSFRTAKKSSLITEVLNKLFADTKETKPSLLKASGIWLFCLVQYCAHLPEVQRRLREAQASFMRLLNARDELVQETASRGLSLVYEKGDPALKDELVRDLVAAFTGTGAKIKVDDETELFEPGALPTGEGKSVVSYKDIVSLANEVGDPSLVYKMMSLATNAATWSTRSAFGRFGLSSILGDTKLEPKVYSKLFRYRFDPNTNVQRSMNDIWKALVKESNIVLEENFDLIIRDLLTSILDKEWRAREASCGAIVELLQGRKFDRYEPYYAEIWEKAIKVLDDLKGTVRNAAFKLCSFLANNIVRLLEESNTTAATQGMLKEALPFLMSTHGMESNVEEVKLFATMTVLKIAKHGGKALKPFVPGMVPQLLGLLSTIEPEVINYHYQRLGEDNREKLDQARASMVNHSPISEAIDNCLRQVDGPTMAELAPRLEATIKSAIGMPTKIGCSRVLTTLFTRHQHDIAPFAPRFLKIIEKQILDKNDSVSKGYAKAAAYMIRVASDPAKEQFCSKLTDLYYAGGDFAETRRQKVADALVAISHVSPDHFSALESRLLPFAYLGSHDTDDYTKTTFETVWNQHAGSSRTVARYVPEIVALVQRGLETAQWALQHTAALTVAAMVPAVGSASDSSNGQIAEASLKLMWPVLDKALALKTFAGKEKLLEAFPEFVSKGRALWTTDTAVAAQLKKIAFREAKRNNEAYRVHAFKSLWRFAEARDDLNMLQEIADIVVPFLDDFKDDGKMELDAKNDATTKVVTNGVEAVARGYSRREMQEAPEMVLQKIMTILGPYLSSDRFALVKRDVWYKCVADLMETAAAPRTTATAIAEMNGESLAMAYAVRLDISGSEVGTEAQRSQRARAVVLLLKARAAGVLGVDAQQDDLRGMVKKALGGERSLDVQREWREALEGLG